MKHINRWFILVLMIAGLVLSGCGARATEGETPEKSPAKVEHLQGANPTRVTLTEDAAKRLDIQTAPAQVDAIPFAAVLYDTEGHTWVYTNPESLVFLRTPVVIDHVEGDQAFLSKALPNGSKVVTIGAEELYGSETEFEEE